MTDRAVAKRLLVDWLPSVVLAVAGTHELLYNHSAFWEWGPAEALIWLLVLRRRAPELVLAATLALGLVGWLQDDLLISHLDISEL